MKFKVILIQILVLLLIFTSLNCLRGAPKGKGKAPVDIDNIDIDKLSDKQVEEMMKDPKFNPQGAAMAQAEADIAKEKIKSLDPSKNPESDAAILAKSVDANKEEDTTQDLKGIKVHEFKKPKQHKSVYESAYAEHMESLKKEGLAGKDDKLDLDGDLSPQTPDVANKSKGKDDEKKKKEAEKKKVPEAPKAPPVNFSYFTETNLSYLIEILKQPVFFNLLPNEAKTLVQATTDKSVYIDLKNSQINKFLENTLKNSQNSQVYIDPDGKLSRKGMLTLIDPLSSSSKFVWAVSNSKVFCFFQSQSFLTIIKLFRNSELDIKDIPATPCFLSTSNKEQGSIFICSASVEEKEVWLQTISQNIKS